jgi:hypothetical protein
MYRGYNGALVHYFTAKDDRPQRLRPPSPMAGPAEDIGSKSYRHKDIFENATAQWLRHYVRSRKSWGRDPMR